ARKGSHLFDPVGFHMMLARFFPRQPWAMVMNYGVEDRFIDATRARLFHDFCALNSLPVSISKQLVGRLARRDDVVGAGEVGQVVGKPPFQELSSASGHNR
ncbi:hypothetical protein, partial [Mesorhizobium amorphae]|uniref:hypothetical protein n=1 Tax=Mesorhizobium amorphae TaxID=71433 RepID=UPI0031F5CEA6